MAIDFSQVKAITIPEGDVLELYIGNVSMWKSAYIWQTIDNTTRVVSRATGGSGAKSNFAQISPSAIAIRIKATLYSNNRWASNVATLPSFSNANTYYSYRSPVNISSPFQQYLLTAIYGTSSSACNAVALTLDTATGYLSLVNNISGYTSGGSRRAQLTISKIEQYIPINILENITISNPITSLNIDSTFSFGGTVTATYSNGSTADVTSSTTFSGYNMSTAGTYTVTASYMENGVTKTATYQLDVKVKEKLYRLFESISSTGNMTGNLCPYVNNTWSTLDWMFNNNNVVVDNTQRWFYWASNLYASVTWRQIAASDYDGWYIKTPDGYVGNSSNPYALSYITKGNRRKLSIKNNVISCPMEIYDDSGNKLGDDVGTGGSASGNAVLNLQNATLYSYSIDDLYNLLPAQNKTTNAYGMYDTINKVFYPITISGTITVTGTIENSDLVTQYK